MNETVALSHRVPFSAISAVLRVTVERQIRGARALAFSVLHTIPVALAVIARYNSGGIETDQLEKLLVFGLIPQALIPLTALLFAAGMANDDVEERTITYLFIRPIPKWLIYLAKLAATIVVTSLLAWFAMLATLTAIHWGEADLFRSALPYRAGVLCATSSLSLCVYVPVFGVMSLAVNRSLILGVLYIVLLEGLLANVDFVVRRGTVMYWVRIIWIRFLNVEGGPWSIDAATAPSATTGVLTLLGVGCLLATIGASIFSRREFRMKTSETN